MRIMYLFFGVLATLFASVPLFAQNPDKLGRLSAVDMEAKLAPEDADAPCVDLYKHRTVTFNYTHSDGFYFVAENVLRRKILTTDGLSKGTITLRARVYTASTREHIQHIDGYTYTVDGGNVVKTPLKSSSVYRESDSDYETIRIVMPVVQVGSVIELKYTLTSPFLSRIPEFYFRDMHPVAKATYDIIVPDFMQVMMHVQTVTPFTEKEERDQQENFPDLAVGTYGKSTSTSRAYHWTLTNQTALHTLPYSTTPFDFANTISTEFQKIALEQYQYYRADSWQSIADNILDFEKVKAGMRVKLPLPIVLASPIGTSSSDTLARIKALYEHFQRKMSVDEDRYLMTKRELSAAYTASAASPTDINLMLCNALRALQIPNQLLLVSTRRNGRPPAFPRQSGFDRIIVAASASGKSILMDASDKDCPFGLLSMESQNRYGLLLTKYAALIPLYTDACRLSTYSNTRLTWDKQKKAFTGPTEHTYSGYSMVEERRSLRKEGMVGYLKNYSKTHALTSPPVISSDSLSNNLILKGEYSYSPTEVDSELYLDPLFGTGLKESPFLAQSRDQDVNLGGRLEMTYMVTCQVPEGYSVKSLPKGALANLGPEKKGKLTYSVSFANGQISTLARLTLKEPSFTVSEYQDLRDFFNYLIAQSSEQIVLQKTR